MPPRRREWAKGGKSKLKTLQITKYRKSERSAILALAKAAIKNPRKVLREGLRKHE